MSFFKKLSELFSTPGGADASAYWLAVKCNRCGEAIRARINLNNDLSLDYDQDGRATYFCRKMLIGEGRCFQRVEVELTFDKDKRLVDREISGGQFVDE